MSDNDVDDELLALADEDSASEAEASKPISRQSKSPSLPLSPPPTTTPQPQLSSAPKGVAQRKTMKSSRAKRRQRDESDEEGEASSAAASPNSLGSGAMSESDSEGLPGAAAADDPLIFPVDGIFRSEREKADINSMPEIERERLLAERAEEAEKLAQSAKLRQLMVAREQAAATGLKKRKAGSTELEDSPRKSSRAKTKQSENLAAYKRQREQRNEERRRGDDRKAKDKRSPSQENGYSDVDADGESDVEWDDGPSKPSATRDEPPPTLRDYERVKVGRTNFARVCFYPGFEDAIKGCFVRVAIGINKTTGENTYRMTQIKGFVQGRPYVMEGVNGRPFHTNQYAILSHGKAEKEWPFIACSDSRISEAEFDRYNQTLVADGLRTPTGAFLEAKCAAIQQLLDHRWTEEEISEKLRRTQAIQIAAANYDRERLEKQRKLAVANGNDTELARVDQELAALDGTKPAAGLATITSSNTSSAAKPAVVSKVPTQQERLAAINRANRKANAEEIRKAQLEDKRRAEAQKQAMLKGEAVANPFARVKTRAKVHHDANGNETLQVKRVDDLFGDGSDISRAATPTPGAPKNGGTPIAAGAGVKGESSGLGGLKKKVMDDDILGAMDLGIEIDI